MFGKNIFNKLENSFKTQNKTWIQKNLRVYIEPINLFDKYKNELKTPDCKEISQLLNELKMLDEKFVIVGDATEEYETSFKSEIDCEILTKKIETSLDIGKVALNKYCLDENSAKNPSEVNPIYLRLAQPDRGV